MKPWCAFLLFLARGAIVADAGCAITPDSSGHVNIPDSWSSIEDRAFEKCVSLISVTVSDTVTSIGNDAFYKSGLTSITFGSGSQLQSISYGAFGYTPLQTCTCGGGGCPADIFKQTSEESQLKLCVGCSVGEIFSVPNDVCVTCPLKEGCLNGATCATNYEGEGCAVCSSGYFELNDTCRKCPGTNIALLLTLGLLFTAMFGVGAYYLSGKLINFAGLSTISIGHFQSITVFMTITFPIPDVFYLVAKRVQAVFALMYIDLFFSPECVSRFDFFQKWQLLTFLPVGFLVILYLWEGCKCRHSDPRPEEKKNSDRDDTVWSEVPHTEVVDNAEETASSILDGSGDCQIELFSMRDIKKKHATIPTADAAAVAAVALAAEDENEDELEKKHSDPVKQEKNNSWGCCCSYSYSYYCSWCCCCISYFCSKICIPEFGRMLNLGVVILYIYLLSQGWKMWDCQSFGAYTGGYVLKADPNISCFQDDERWMPPDDPRATHGDHEANMEHIFNASIALILLLACTYLPFKLYDGLRYELFSSHHSKLEHEKSMGFLYLKYKPEYWYWEPVVEMSRKWFLVFFSTFMPTAALQATMDIVIILVYWGLHAWCLPYRTDWVDAEGIPADPDLENKMQHYLYGLQLTMIIVMSAHSSYDKNPDVGGAVLLFVYFLGIGWIAYAIVRTMARQKIRSQVVSPEQLGQGRMSTFTSVIKKIFDGMGK